VRRRRDQPLDLGEHVAVTTSSHGIARSSTSAYRRQAMFD
jgi:hypothetical protein